MTNRCLDEGILQSYIDGELSREQAADAAAHLAACGVCSAALAEAEGETSFFAARFTPDEALSVPSEALRARINASIAQLEAAAEPNPRRSTGRGFGGFLASLSGLFSFTPQGAVAFATLLAAVAIGIIYFSSRNPQQRVNKPQAAPAEVAQVSQPTASAPEPAVVEPPSAPNEKGNGRSGYAQVKHGPRVVRRVPPAPSAPKEEALPGEKEYQTAIASLEKTIKVGGDESLRPSLRADYERNLALLDSAITQTRQVAARNPKDKDAVDFLMAAYQSKVELLTRVADQAQVSALGR